MLAFDKLKKEQLKDWLSSAYYIHDSVIESNEYECKTKSLSVVVTNDYFHTKIRFQFKNIVSLFINNRNECGNPGQIIAGTLEDNHSLFAEKFGLCRNKIEEYLYFTFQMFSMDELHILCEQIVIETIR